jgi:hypothetical protein
MELTITVPNEVQLALEQRARARGCKDITKYVEYLISIDLLSIKSFDDILAPIRQAFQESEMSENELETLFEEAREEVYQERKINER